jgi:hypothetical protein
VEGLGENPVGWKVTSTIRNCRECTCRLEEDNIYGLCADCYEQSIN